MKIQHEYGLTVVVVVGLLSALVTAAYADFLRNHIPVRGADQQQWRMAVEQPLKPLLLQEAIELHHRARWLRSQASDTALTTSSGFCKAVD